MLVIGLWTYGYNIMQNLGNRITLHSPSRGFSMELGSAVAVIMATRLSMCRPLRRPFVHGVAVDSGLELYGVPKC
jgi:phosphate/sulfate permease